MAFWWQWVAIALGDGIIKAIALLLALKTDNFFHDCRYLIPEISAPSSLIGSERSPSAFCC
ncbi:hypothetical protein H6G41_24475 [Tolypothrix sp. FACHB-123]|uniref:hypothetical protein n=1 Tax=Tolypothrix sp. FACHB-123 TaxID=2692868 RepID=UPI001684468C|nr:hypothetical protein [Tolypothrix sp. FACHB-123]MBD2357728.1 hypothetical protein [Tolypothrix sp. FACHB-123]